MKKIFFFFAYILLTLPFMHAAEDKDSFEKFQEMVRTTCEVPT